MLFRSDDDRMIMSEGGTSNLSRSELEAACEARGMRVVALSDYSLKRQLDEWLDLSLNQGVPMTLLILSRAFQIATVDEGNLQPTTERALQESMSSIDKNVVQEVVLAQGGDAESKEAALLAMTMKLQSVAFQNELIAAEREALVSCSFVLTSKRKHLEFVILRRSRPRNPTKHRKRQKRRKQHCRKHKRIHPLPVCSTIIRITFDAVHNDTIG